MHRLPWFDGAPHHYYLSGVQTLTGEAPMHHEFTAVYERDGDWVVAFCPEVPGANGQGRTKAEARESLSAAEKELISVDVRAA